MEKRDRDAIANIFARARISVDNKSVVGTASDWFLVWMREYLEQDGHDFNTTAWLNRAQAPEQQYLINIAEVDDVLPMQTTHLAQ